jgi:coenzyme F420-0:L-glutamate ligase / coenzyme F420-1:gamma-L-glutamate ligase
MTSDLHTFLRTRRSIRHFKNEPVPLSTVERILETATFAPSAHDKQPWRFVVISSPEAKELLAKIVTDKFRLDMSQAGADSETIQARVDRTIRRTDAAPIIVLLCRDTLRMDEQVDEAGRAAEKRMGEQSVALAGLQLLLAAHAEGLGGTWICWPLYAAQEICQAFDLPTEWEPQGMVFLGFPAEQPATPARSAVAEITRYL